MTSLVRDENRVAGIGAESTLTRTIIPAKIDSSSGRLLVDALINDGTPTDPSKANASLVLGYDLSGNLSTITKTIGTTQYQKTLTYTGSNLTGVSAWVQL